ncbi:jg22337 [Pararge aegeria aegeria]|uniref:Jg22337 protein n=1 Tax=Pararge aegeria aegeria TaxID=348720 RepID=A0A8S4SAF1_9NEOP|nr:jg22337 [Pararge aegeria aegeria]
MNRSQFVRLRYKGALEMLFGRLLDLECPSDRRSGLQSEEPPHNTRCFKDYCLVYPTHDPTTKRKLPKMLVEGLRPLTATTIGTITVD